MTCRVDKLNDSTTYKANYDRKTVIRVSLKLLKTNNGLLKLNFIRMSNMFSTSL